MLNLFYFVLSLQWIQCICMDIVYIPAEYTASNVSLGKLYSLTENTFKDELFSDIEQIEKLSTNFSGCVESFAIIKNDEDNYKVLGKGDLSILTISDKLMNMKGVAAEFMRRSVNRTQELEIVIFIECIKRKDALSEKSIPDTKWEKQPEFYVSEIIHGSQLFLTYTFLPKLEGHMIDIEYVIQSIIKKNSSEDGLEIVSEVLSQLDDEIFSYSVNVFAQDESGIHDVFLSIDDARDYVKKFKDSAKEEVLKFGVLPFNPFMDALLPMLRDVSETEFYMKMWKSKYENNINLDGESLEFMNALLLSSSMVTSLINDLLQPSNFSDVDKQFIKYLQAYNNGLSLTDTSYIEAWRNFLSQKAKNIDLTTISMQMNIKKLETEMYKVLLKERDLFYRLGRPTQHRGRERRLYIREFISGSRRFYRSGMMRVPDTGLFTISFSVQISSGDQAVVKIVKRLGKNRELSEAETKKSQTCRQCAQTISGSFTASLTRYDILFVLVSSDSEKPSITIGGDSYFSAVMLKKF